MSRREVGCSHRLHFFALIHALRRLQEAGLVGTRLGRKAASAAAGTPAEVDSHLLMTFIASDDPISIRDLSLVRHLLDLPSRTMEIEMVYGPTPSFPGQIALLTRSILGVIGQLAFQVDVPTVDVQTRRTVVSVASTANEPRPIVVVQSGTMKPRAAFSAIRYRDRWFWIADEDFDSKVAFTIVNILLALAQTSSSPNTVITIPAK